MQDSHKKQILSNISKVQKKTPLGWSQLQKISIGGIIGIGFSKVVDILLVISHQGRGIIDCNTGEVITRDKEEYGDWYQEMEMSCQGIGILSSERIQISGIYGGGLPLINNNGEELALVAPDYPIFDIIYMPDGKSIFDSDTAVDCYRLASNEDFRGFGFSYSGNIIVIAVADGLKIYKRINQK